MSITAISRTRSDACAQRASPSLVVAALAALLMGANAAWAVGQTQELAVERSDRATFRVVTVAEGLEHPWAMAFLPDGRALVTERDGRLRLLDADGELSPPLGGVPNVAARGQGGLLDVAVHPAFAENGLVYLSFAGPGAGGAGTEVVRGRLAGTALVDVEAIFSAEPKTGGGRHFGSRLAFAPDGTLFITTGDRGGYSDNAQSTADHIGTVVRLNDDGSVPPDNPFVGTSGAKPEIFSYGHRNAQGLALRPGTSTLWSHEHGPRGGDEVNILKAGANYGWPAITYGIDYSGRTISEFSSAPGMEQPVLYWDPSIAPSGMAFYDGEAFPEWQGDLFVGALSHTHLRRLELDGDRVVAQEILLDDLGERIRDVRQGPDGFLYVLTDSDDGRVLRLEPLS